MRTDLSRRIFLNSLAGAAGGIALTPIPARRLLAAQSEPLFKISLGEWSLHRALFGGHLKHVDVAKTIKHDFGIDALEYSAQFFKDKSTDRKYLKELSKRAAAHDVKAVLITVDDEGNLGDPDKKRRGQAVENHHKWVEAGKLLGCESIRVNAHSDPSLSEGEQARLVVDGLTSLVEFGAQHEVNVIVENHGGVSSNAKWLANVVKHVNLPTCGTLPDFGNFHTQPGVEYDRYQGVAELMPFAKAVSAKSYDFDAGGNETTIDYHKMLRIVVDAGFRGYLGVEYEGPKLSEPDGIRATKKLLETIRDELTPR